MTWLTFNTCTVIQLDSKSVEGCSKESDKVNWSSFLIPHQMWPLRFFTFICSFFSDCSSHFAMFHVIMIKCFYRWKTQTRNVPFKRHMHIKSTISHIKCKKKTTNEKAHTHINKWRITAHWIHFPTSKI